MDSEALPASFCIIEDRNTVQNFAKLQLDEITSSIQVRFPYLCVQAVGHDAHAGIARLRRMLCGACKPTGRRKQHTLLSGYAAKPTAAPACFRRELVLRGR